jgi:chromosome segregation ATPase
VESPTTGTTSLIRKRAHDAGRTARRQLPATREDVARLQASLDRIEAELATLSARVEELKPRRRSGGDTKPKS